MKTFNNSKITALIFLAFIYQLLGCSVAMPVHEAEPPMTLGAGGIRFGVFSGTSPTYTYESDVLTENENTIVPTVIMGYKFAIGILENLDLNAQFMASMGSGAASTVGLKYQILGSSTFNKKPGHILSVGAHYVSSSSGENDEEQEVEVDSQTISYFQDKLTLRGYDANITYGYMPTSFFGVYIGGKIMNHTFDIEYREDLETNPLQSQSRTLQGYGPFTGLFLVGGWSHFMLEFTTEYSYFFLPGTASAEMGNTQNLVMNGSLLFSF